MKLLQLVSLVIGLVGMFNVAAAADDKLSLADVIKQATVDMPISTPPASFMLGASGETVPRLTSFRSFATHVARAYDNKGSVANAVGVELAPALAMGRMSWSDITGSQSSRILSRTLVSFATKVKSGDLPSQSAVGVQSILWAPAMDAVLASVAGADCTGVATKVNETPPPPEPSPGPPLSPEQLKQIEACQQIIDAQLTKWNQPMVSVGAGRTITSSEAPASSKTKNSSAFWITGAYGADIGSKKDDHDAVNRMGYLVTAHYRQSTNVPSTASNGSDAFAKQRLTGVNGRYGNARLAGIAEISVVRSVAAGVDFNARKRALLGLEYKIDKDLYLTVGTARDTGATASKQSVLANINWGFSKEPVLLSK